MPRRLSEVESASRAAGEEAARRASVKPPSNSALGRYVNIVSSAPPLT
jgi:hypothetical protein